MLQHFDISKNVKTWTVSQNFDISKNVQAWTVSQNFDTSKNVKAWVVSQNIHTINNVNVWAASQHTDTSKSTMAALGCCYALHGYMETIFNHDRRVEVPSALQKWRQRLVRPSTLTPARTAKIRGIMLCAAWLYED